MELNASCLDMRPQLAAHDFSFEHARADKCRIPNFLVVLAKPKLNDTVLKVFSALRTFKILTGVVLTRKEAPAYP